MSLTVDQAVLKALLSRDAWESWGPVVDPGKLIDKPHQLIYGAIKRFHEEDLGAPNGQNASPDSLWRLLVSEYGTPESAVDDRVGNLQEFLSLAKVVLKTIKESGQDDGVTGEMVRAFLRKSAIRKLGGEVLAINDLPQERWPDQWEQVKQLCSDVLEVDEAGSEGIEPVQLSKLEELSLSRGRTIPLGFEKLDEAMGGGPFCGVVGCVVAPPKVGKTQFLVNCGVNAILAGRDVVHFTLEIDATTLATWYLAQLFETPIDDVVPTAMKPGWGELYIHDYRGRHCSIWTIKRAVKSHVARGRGVDLLMLDYLALLDRDSDDRYAPLGREMRELRKLGTKYDLVALTAAQANRYAEIDGRTLRQHIADSYEIPRVVDYLILLSQSREEKLAGLMWADLDANRLGRGNPVVEMTVDYQTLRLKA